MAKWFAVGVSLAFTAGCAPSQDALVKRRDEIRAYNAAATHFGAVDVRSSEGVRGATWGMTEAELVALKGQPDDRAEGALMYLDEVDGAEVPTTYLFEAGHLALVKSRFDALTQPVDRLIRALDRKWGQPKSDFDKAAARREAIDSARRWDWITLGVGATLVTAAALASGGAAHASANYPWWFAAEDAGDRRLLEYQLKNDAAPARDVVWSTAASEVHLVALDSGVSEVTWASKLLGRKLVHEQMSAAGIDRLAKSM